MSTERLSRIRSLIDQADQAYYPTGEALMEDAVYDALKDELRTLSPDDVRLHRVGAPEQGDVAEKRAHPVPMGSQEKVTNEQEWNAWLERVGHPQRLHASLKMDGGSNRFEFRDGRLIEAVTRGDGIEGEVITHNAVKFKGAPKVAKIDGSNFTGSIRGEVMLVNEDWKKVDPDLKTNPRNLGNGISRRKDGAQTEMLSLYAFRCFDASGKPFTVGPRTEEAMSRALSSMGFQISPYLVGTADEVWAYFKRIEQERPSLPFWIDGIVVKIDDLDAQLALGESGGCPRGQVALKFTPKGEESIVRNIELTVGHTGAVIPTAKFDPVFIGGTTVSSALLCNWQEIAALDIAIGDRVMVVKRGDIIPKVIKVCLRPGDRRVVQEPEACPVCQEKLVRHKTVGGGDTAQVFCDNPECDSKILGKLNRWITGLNILGLGDGYMEALVEQLDVKDASDLYRLKDRRAALAAVTSSGVRMGESRADKLLAEIESKRDISLEDFIGSLGVEGVAQRRVELVRSKVPGQMDTLADWQSDKLLQIAEAAGVRNMAEVIVRGMSQRGPLIARLLDAGVTVRKGEQVSPVDAAASSVCFTGKSRLTRDELQGIARDKGWVVKDGVSKGLTYLVMADANSNSSKASKARSIGTKCISEEEFLAMVNAS